eukprot:3300017-Pyramimonas_sp.AAC.1
MMHIRQLQCKYGKNTDVNVPVEVPQRRLRPPQVRPLLSCQPIQLLPRLTGGARLEEAERARRAGAAGLAPDWLHPCQLGLERW